MTQDRVIEPADEDLPTDPAHTSLGSEYPEEASRIAALLRDRFGVER